MELGQFIRSLMRERELSQRQLAAEADIDETYLSKIVNGRLEHPPSVKTLRALASALGSDELQLMKLANRLPVALEGIAGDEAALRFFRRASERQPSSKQWEHLLAILESVPSPETERSGPGS